MLVTLILAAQLVLCTLAAYAFARYEFPGRDLAFALVLVQLMVMPDVLIVENYRSMSRLGILDSTLAIGLPYMASAFGVFLLRQTFKTDPPKSSTTAARVEGASALQVLWKVYVPLARPVYVAYALVSVSYHWNNFLWPIIVTNSVNSRPLTVGLQGVFVDRPGNRLVDHLRRDADDERAAARRVPAVPAPVRAVVHARRHSIGGHMLRVFRFSAFLLLCLACAGVRAQPRPERVDLGAEARSFLWVGNSFFYYNNSMHGHVAALGRG
jgi:ABC-type glycerol-3-phosphate transport system permease component